MSLARQLKSKAFHWADRLLPVRPLPRSNTEHELLERESRRMQLYFSRACPASIGVQRYCQRLGLRVVEKDVQRITAYRNELLNGGGASKVPCLRIEDAQGSRWIYSSDTILSFLDQRFNSL